MNTTPAPVPANRHRLAAILSLAFLLAAGSASAGQRRSAEERLARDLDDRGFDPAAVVLPFELSDEMRRWAHETAPRRLHAEQKLDRLATRLLESDELALEYSWGYTGTAREVFEDRRANCLAFTNLFLGMAREVGVPVYFLAIATETYRKHEDLVVVSDHIAVGYGAGREIEMYDFGETPDQDYPDVRRISDLTAIAMFHSNRGTEVLQQGRFDDAQHWLRTAVALDPELATAWVNLGVALRRSGDLAAAEDAYRRALELDPRTYTAYQNLASVLRLRGRVAEARELEVALRKSPTRNPFSYLALGDISFRSGRLDEARRLYRRAASLDRGHAESYAALGQLAVVQGDLTTARKMLKKARRLDALNQRTAKLASMVSSTRG